MFIDLEERLEEVEEEGYKVYSLSMILNYLKLLKRKLKQYLSSIGLKLKKKF